MAIETRRRVPGLAAGGSLQAPRPLGWLSLSFDMGDPDGNHANLCLGHSHDHLRGECLTGLQDGDRAIVSCATNIDYYHNEYQTILYPHRYMKV